MDKNVKSVILLCLMAAALVLTAVIGIRSGMALYELHNTPLDPSDEQLPLGSLIGAMVAEFSVWCYLVIGGGITSSLGIVFSWLNVKTASHPVIHRLSRIFLTVFSVLLIAIVSIPLLIGLLAG